MLSQDSRAEIISSFLFMHGGTWQWGHAYIMDSQVNMKLKHGFLMLEYYFFFFKNEEKTSIDGRCYHVILETLINFWSVLFLSWRSE